MRAIATGVWSAETAVLGPVSCPEALKASAWLSKPCTAWHNIKTRTKLIKLGSNGESNSDYLQERKSVLCNTEYIAYRHNEGLTRDTACIFKRWRKITKDTKYLSYREKIHELSHRMELLHNSCSPDAFLFYTSKLDSMASSHTHRRAKKASRFRSIIDHNFTDNSLNQQVNNTNASNNDISSNVTHNACKSTATCKHSCRKTKPANIQLEHSSVINLSNSSLFADEISVLARGLTFCLTPWHINWSEVSANI